VTPTKLQLAATDVVSARLAVSGLAPVVVSATAGSGAPGVGVSPTVVKGCGVEATAKAAGGVIGAAADQADGVARATPDVGDGVTGATADEADGREALQISIIKPRQCEPHGGDDGE